MIENYTEYIWHNPNCDAFHRERKTNKPYPHLEKFGKYECTCGYDEDFNIIQELIYHRNTIKIILHSEKLLIRKNAELERKLDQIKEIIGTKKPVNVDWNGDPL